MIRRREFLQAVVAVVATPMVILDPKPVKTDAKTDEHCRVTCEETTNNEIKAAYLGDELIWSESRRKISWSTKDVDLMPEVGSIIQIEQDFGGGNIERYRAVVVGHERL